MADFYERPHRQAQGMKVLPQAALEKQNYIDGVNEYQADCDEHKPDSKKR
jgi:hypothetical protein